MTMLDTCRGILSVFGMVPCPPGKVWWFGPLRNLSVVVTRTPGGLVLILISSLISAAMAANPCAGVKVSTDEFTKAKVSMVEGSAAYISSYTEAEWKAEFKDGKAWLTLSMSSRDRQLIKLPAGFPVKFLFEDGNVLELGAPSEVEPAFDPYFTIWSVAFPLEGATLSAFADQRVVSVRATLPKGDQTWKLGGAKLQKAVGCYASLVQ